MSNEKPLCDIISEYSNHESVKCIKEQIKGNSHTNNFTLRFVTERETINVMKSLSSKKAAGYDDIPAQFIKKLGSALVKPLTQLINRCILENTFPVQMKKANITPLYKLQIS